MARKPTPELQTVTGVLKARDVKNAMAHEHMFVDFLTPVHADYMDVNWSNKIGAAVESAAVLAAQDVNLVIEWTNMGVGRNVLALRDVSRQSGIHFVCPTGVYKDYLPPALRKRSVDSLAEHFIAELVHGIDGTGIHAGFVKTAASESGIKASERPILRAAARAAKRTGAAIGFHGPHARPTLAAATLFAKEGFDLNCLVWAHAQGCTLSENLKLAGEGVWLQYDAVGAHGDPYWGDIRDDTMMLDRLEDMVAAGYEDKIMLSTDASVCVNPPGGQYDRHNAYLYRFFEDKLIERLGARRSRKILRNNVVEAFRRPDRLKA